MTSLLNLFKSLEHGDYNYYRNPNRLDFDSLTDPKSTNFIGTYFSNGGKKFAIHDIVSQFDGEFSFRATHSVMVYLIGIILNKNNADLRSSIERQLDGNGIDDFLYIWFLICLYHDYKSADEHSSIKFTNRKNDHSFMKQEEGCCPDNSLAYNEYRKAKGSKDHGIYGGLLLREKLNENHRNAINNSGTKTPENFEYDGLHWSTNHEKWYDLAASIIIKHNIDRKSVV